MPMLPEILVSQPHASGYLLGMVDDLGLLEQLGLAKLRVDGSVRRIHQRSLTFKIGDKLVLMDGNNRPEPTANVMEKGTYDLIIKMQYRPSKFWDKCASPITSWTFTEMVHKSATDRFDKFKTTEKKFRCGFVGRWYYARVGLLKKLAKVGDTDVEYWHKQRHAKVCYPIGQYLNRVCSWQTAYVPAGRSRETGDGIDGKTWREIECASMGIPMILDKDRDYHIKLNPYEHYIPLQGSDFEKAIKEAIEDKELGIRARQWYDSIASPVGVCRTFIEILEKYGILHSQGI